MANDVKKKIIEGSLDVTQPGDSENSVVRRVDLAEKTVVTGELDGTTLNLSSVTIYTVNPVLPTSTSTEE